MKVFDSEKIRNIAVVGHGDTGKTTLVSAFLYTTGAVNRLGNVEDGTTVTDYDEDEIERKITINTTLAHCQWKDHKINLLDTPGYRAFIFDAKAAMPAVETAMVLVDAVSGVEVQTELAWGFAEEYKVPRVVVINKLDRDNASFKRTVDSLQETLAREVVPVQLPIGEEKEFQGIIDLISNKAFYYELDGKGKPTIKDIPADMAEEVKARREELIEMIAESDDELIEKFFEAGTLSNEDLLAGMANSIKAGTFFPAFCTAASRNAGISALLDAITSLFPNPLEKPAMAAVDMLA